MHDVPDIEDLHRAACRRGDVTYVDPGSGYCVFTADALRARGRCCGCGCRHCGEAFPETGLAARRARGGALPPPRMLNGRREDLAAHVDVLFWSGGKDSFLALRQLAREAPAKDRVLLLTTFDAREEIVAHQEVHVSVVQRQARALGVSLVGVPLDGGKGEYLAHLAQALDWIRAEGVVIRRLAFGDLHLAHVREWRDTELTSLGDVKLYYPLWKRDYEDMLRELLGCGVPARVCAVGQPEKLAGSVSVGDIFDRKLLARLPPNVDRFGEDGEFHSVVEVWADTANPLPWGKEHNRNRDTRVFVNGA